MHSYHTTKGDTFDSISLLFYDDEFKAHLLMEANPQHIKTVVFESGITLQIPILQEEVADTLPPWKR